MSALKNIILVQTMNFAVWMCRNETYWPVVGTVGYLSHCCNIKNSKCSSGPTHQVPINGWSRVTASYSPLCHKDPRPLTDLAVSPSPSLASQVFHGRGHCYSTVSRLYSWMTSCQSGVDDANLCMYWVGKKMRFGALPPLMFILIGLLLDWK